ASALQRAQLWRYRGLVHHERGEFEVAAAAHLRAVELTRTAEGERHPEHTKALVALANAHRALRRFELAEAEYRRALEIERGLLGRTHPRLANAIHGLVDVLLDRHRPSEALDAYEEAYAIHVASVGPEHLDVAGDRLAMARAKLALGRRAEARVDLE